MKPRSQPVRAAGQSDFFAASVESGRRVIASRIGKLSNVPYFRF